MSGFMGVLSEVETWTVDIIITINVNQNTTENARKMKIVQGMSILKKGD